MEKIIDAIYKAVLRREDLITGDAINALEKGHGMLNVTAFCAANSIAEEIINGRDIKLKAANSPEIELDKVVKAGVDTALRYGADASNAALITATLLYIAGSNVRAGVPSGNRKLGAMARMMAGAQRGGVANLPTPKSNNKLSGFPAVLKIYEAMLEGRLTQVDGYYVPPGISGTPLCGHSALGEDILFPEIARNAASIGTAAMLKAYAGVGLKPNPFISAVFGAAAALEIVHPDATVGDEYGPSMKTFTPFVAGKGAVEAAGLPETIHFRVTNEEFKTAEVIGDLGIILKDMGTPTVVGMMAFYELLGCFKESAAIGTGGSGGPKTAPLGHLLADASIALRLITRTHSIEEAARVIKENKQGFLDPVFATILANTVARKVESLRSGPVSQAVIKATEDTVKEAIKYRVKKTYEGLENGALLKDIVASLEQERVSRVEMNSKRIMEELTGKNCEIRLLKLTPGARRSAKLGKKYLVLDADVDVRLIVGEEERTYTGFLHKSIPEAVIGKNKKELALMALAAPAVGELLVTGHTLIDLEIPAAVAVIMRKHTPQEAAEMAICGGSIAGGLPGCKEKVEELAELADKFYKTEIW